ncbi:(2Fe-2S)-binding protein [Candidatus Sumerlaeota bacterium]|nr:(2Fe-2S)-binding protein [Candidatus Sumerlaeota bacterium]
MHDDEQSDVQQAAFRTSRRGFLKGVGIASAATVVLPGLSLGQEEAAGTPGLKEFGSGPLEISLKVNGDERKLSIEPRTTLLDALRTKLALTGTKEICDRGSCGGCTVLVDGRAMVSCMTLAIDMQGREITTAEGIGKDPGFAPLVDSFCEHDAAQCGFCIPGILVRSAALLKEIPNPTPLEIREGLAGNICRCGTYSRIFDAVEACAKKGGVA